MGCNCGGRRIEGARATLKRSYQMPVYDDLYEGEAGDTPLYVVAIGTENERAFTRANRNEAITLARVNDWTIDVLPARSLSRELVIGALSGDGAQPRVDA